ncbi:MAG: SDR family oxidoreductase [Parvularculaceae bacterium]
MTARNATKGAPGYSGHYALITGASAGLGAAYARALAARDCDLGLVARRADRLESLASELGAAHGVTCDVLPADLNDPSAPDAIAAALAEKGRHTDILINNAGFGLPGYFLENDWQAHRDFLELMVASYVKLAYLLLPGMRAREYGRIINVASLAGLVPGAAGHTLYGAAKAFLISFSQSLAAEYADANVKTSACCPGFTLTEFHDKNGTRHLINKLPKFAIMNAAPVVAGSLAAVERGQAAYVPGAFNKFVSGLIRLLPRGTAARLVARRSAAFRARESLAPSNSAG